MISFIIIVLLSYLIGSIPFAYLVSKLSKGIDIRDFGSGNSGATNVARVIGKLEGIIVLILDIFKGFASVYFITMIDFGGIWTVDVYLLRAAAGIAVVTGHIWTIFLGFKGGKGVATGLGVFLGLSTYPALCAVVLFGVVFSVSKIVSISSVIASLMFPVFLLIWKTYIVDINYSIIISGSLISSMIIIKHIPNIKRIIRKEER